MDDEPASEAWKYTKMEKIKDKFFLKHMSFSQVYL